MLEMSYRNILLHADIWYKSKLTEDFRTINKKDMIRKHGMPYQVGNLSFHFYDSSSNIRGIYKRCITVMKNGSLLIMRDEIND